MVSLLTHGRSFFFLILMPLDTLLWTCWVCAACVIKFHLHTGTPLLLPAHWDPITPTCTLRPHYSYLHTETPLLLPAHWDLITPTCILGPHYSYLHTGTPLPYLHTGTPLLLPAHWDPITPTCTLGPHHSYLHTGTPRYNYLYNDKIDLTI